MLNSFPVDDVSLMRLRAAGEVVHQRRSPAPSFLLQVHCGPSVMLPAQLSWFAAFLQLCSTLPYPILPYPIFHVSKYVCFLHAIRSRALF